MTFQQILSFPRDYQWPTTVGVLSKKFLLNLLKQNPSERLGSRHFNDLKSDEFFKGAMEDGTIEWTKMYTIDPPPQGKSFKAKRERASRIWKALVVDISIPPSSFKPVSFVFVTYLLCS